jgi:hypothetical protein
MSCGRRAASRPAANLCPRSGLALREEGQQALAFLVLVMSVALFETAIDAVTPGVPVVVLDAILLIHRQIAVGIRYDALTLIAFYLA